MQVHNQEEEEEEEAKQPTVVVRVSGVDTGEGKRQDGKKRGEARNGPRPASRAGDVTDG